MKPVLAVLSLALIALVGVHVLQEATEYHGSHGSSGHTSVTFTVATRHYPHPVDDAAMVLWNTCAGTVGWDSEDQPVRQADGSYLATLRPSLGSDTTRRLRGCLNEATLDRVEGNVRSTLSTTAP